MTLDQSGYQLLRYISAPYAFLDLLHAVVALAHDVREPSECVLEVVGVGEVQQLLSGDSGFQKETERLWRIVLHIEGQNCEGADIDLIQRPDTLDPVPFELTSVYRALTGVDVDAVLCEVFGCLHVVSVTVGDERSH